MNTGLTPLQQATQVFINTVKDESSDYDSINVALKKVYESLSDASEEEAGESMKSMFELIHMPELNDEIYISEEDLSVLNGRGALASNNSIAGKWNMYSYSLPEKNGWKELVNNQTLVSESTTEYSGTWIWSEGIPAHIPVYKGKPACQRNIGIQRTFKNLKATIQMDKVLSEKEIEKWLS